MYSSNTNTCHVVMYINNITLTSVYYFFQVLTGLLLAIRLYCLLCQLSRLSSVQIERMRLTVSRIGVGQCNLV